MKKVKQQPTSWYWDNYRRYTESASQTARNAALAGLAAVWLFSGGASGGTAVLEAAPQNLLVAGGAFGVALCLDVGQYFVGAATYRILARSMERRDVPEMEQPWWAPVSIEVCFFLKAVALAVGYALIAWHLFGMA